MFHDFNYPAILAAYHRMMAGLLQHQAEDGMWRQLINYPEAWKETSSTAMFSYAMVVGVRRGLLTDPAYTGAYRKAWTTLATYVQPDGKLTEIGAGTGRVTEVRYEGIATLSRPITSNLDMQLAGGAEISHLDRSDDDAPAQRVSRPHLACCRG